jgi:hypothetical protein
LASEAIIPDNLSKVGWSWGCVSGVDAEGRTIWIVEADSNFDQAIRRV